jgi:tRNA pseudouridine55 synthase
LQIKFPKRDVSGVFLLDKPLGLSSNQAMQKVKHLFQAQKAGHTGSLDPLATGLLPICLGEATKFASFLLDADKAYVATVKLGVKTTTADAEGEVVSSHPVNVSQTQLSDVLQRFMGEIQQTPPIYSALKVDGKPLYSYARSGKTVAIQSRSVTIHRIQLESFHLDEFVITVQCSKGTYIRTLAEDIGDSLGCGAHLSGLRRLTSGVFDLNGAYSLERVSGMSLEELDKLLLPVDVKIQHIPQIKLTEQQTDLVLHGQSVLIDEKNSTNEIKRLYGIGGEFIGLGQLDQDGRIYPKRLIRQKV